MLSPEKVFCYAMASELDSRCLVCMRFSRSSARSLRRQPCLQMAFIRHSRCLPVNVVALGRESELFVSF